MKKLLVHICCAPDALYFLERLREDYPDYELIGFFYDPNIHPYEEYLLRLEETKRACQKLGIELIEGEYNVEDWLIKVKGLEKEPERGQRCSICFDFRLERSARLAHELGCEGMTTTLLMSPKKKFEQLKESGEKVTKPYGIDFLAVNYRKGGGTQEMFRLTRENQIYQQDYCGCVHGLVNQKGEDALWDMVSFGGRPPGSKEETLFIKQLRTFCEAYSLEVREFEFPFLNWSVLEGGLWIGKEPVPSLVFPYSQSIRGKVRADVEKVVGNTLYLNKQFVRIVLVNKLESFPLDRIPFTINPTFLVPDSYKDKLLSNRIDATLKTTFKEGVSRVLAVGNLSAESTVGFPADTLQDGKGLSLELIKTFIGDRREDIVGGKLLVLVLGAHSFGRIGQRFFEEVTGVRVESVVDYSSTETQLL